MTNASGMGSRGTQRALWIVAAGLWVATGFVGLKSYAMELGAAQHDIHCPDHRAPAR